MSVWSHLGGKPEAVFPNRLHGEAAPVSLPICWGTVTLLVLVCLVLRAWMAIRWDIVWPDSVAYIQSAAALERGDPRPLIEQFGLNIYPMILAALHGAGLDWEVAGEGWSVLMASLTVLPLFGWLRRQFDDRIAVIGCLLYAVHPKLMNSSPLIIRDPTFWFLLSLTLYCGWRAAVEVRLRWFLLAGLAWALAIHTRSEGWLLIIPLTLWYGIRWRWALGGPACRAETSQVGSGADRPGKLDAAGQTQVGSRRPPRIRTRLLLGWLLSLAVVPLGIVAVNLTLLHGYSHWVILRSDHARKVGHLLLPSARSPPAAEQPAHAPGGAAPSNNAVGPPPSALTPPPNIKSTRMSGLVAALKAAERVMKAFTYVFGLLLLLGLWHWRSVFLHSDQLALFAFNLALWGSVWLRYWHGLGIDIRYFFPSILVGLGYMAAGLLCVADAVCRVGSRGGPWTERKRSGLILAILGALLAIGIPDRSLSERRFMYQHADLGKWVHQRFGPDRRVVGCMPEMRVILYYADTAPIGSSLPPAYKGKSLLDVLKGSEPEVVFLWDHSPARADVAQWTALLDRHPELPYRRVLSDELPASCRETPEMLVLVRDESGTGKRPGQ
jgi:hypothetical protein